MSQIYSSDFTKAQWQSEYEIMTPTDDQRQHALELFDKWYNGAKPSTRVQRVDIDRFKAIFATALAQVRDDALREAAALHDKHANAALSGFAKEFHEASGLAIMALLTPTEAPDSGGTVEGGGR